MKPQIFLIILSFLAQFTYAQTVSITPLPGTVVWCPNEYRDYTASITDRSGCTFTWSSPDGTFFNGDNTGSTVTFKWSDISSLGKLKVTITCGSGTNAETFVKEESYVIRSLKGVIPQNIRSLATPLPVCNTNSFDVFVDEVIVPNTGPFTNITAKYAEGYEWSVPAGWSKTVNGNRVTITPNNGCSTGNVRVRGYISSCGTADPATWFYSAWSAELSLRTISTPVVSTNSQSSYALQCGSTSGVVFEATDYPSCEGETFTWEFPAGWRTGGNAQSPVTTSSPLIELFPLTTPANAAIVAGGVKVTANLGCGNYASSPLSISYSDPALSNPIFTTASTQLLCSGASGTVTISPISGATNYTWYATDNVKINNVVATASNPVVTTSTTVTVTAPSLASNAGYPSFVYSTANRGNGCAGSSNRSRKVWLGKAAQVYSIGMGFDDIGPFYVCPGQTYQFAGVDFENIQAVTTYNWYAYGNTITSGQGTNVSYVQINSGDQYLSLRAQNACGYKAYKDVFLNSSSNCGGCGGFICRLSVYPNPAETADQIVIEVYDELQGDQTEKRLSAASELSVDVIDSNQKVIYSNSSKNSKLTLPRNTLKKGTYILKLRKGDKVEDRIVIIK